MAAKKPTRKAPAEAGAASTAGDRFITRRDVRDGILVSTEVSYDPNAKIESFDDLKQAFEELFPSAEAQVREIAEYAQGEIDAGASGSRLQYAQHVVQVSEHVIRQVRQGKAEAAVILAIAMMHSVFRVKVKSIEPTVITGAKASQQRKSAGFSSAQEREQERRPEWEQWQNRFTQHRLENPHLSKSRIHEMVAAEFGVTRQAIAKRVR
ncbi:hypothetical protein LJR168_001778 [Pseudoxanthomonas sp. LjRoot168]|uniref:hypothetical protein n=1 Tax=unclassified Pseudoxanthomonas TaxID=2645906 RepID=UPI003ECEC2FF